MLPHILVSLLQILELFAIILTINPPAHMLDLGLENVRHLAFFTILFDLVVLVNHVTHD